MKELRRTLILIFLVGPLIGLYNTFVLKSLWNWFATEALHLPEISFWVMYGLVLIIGMFTDRIGDIGQDYQFKAMATGLDACIPEDKKQWVHDEIEEQQSGMWMDIGFKVFGRVAAVTFTLMLGWAVHTFLV